MTLIFIIVQLCYFHYVTFRENLKLLSSCNIKEKIQSEKTFVSHSFRLLVGLCISGFRLTVTWQMFWGSGLCAIWPCCTATAGPQGNSSRADRDQWEPARLESTDTPGKKPSPKSHINGTDRGRGAERGSVHHGESHSISIRINNRFTESQK